MKLADIVKDGKILTVARELAARILEDDLKLQKDIHAPTRIYLESKKDNYKGWSMIS